MLPSSAVLQNIAVAVLIAVVVCPARAATRRTIILPWPTEMPCTEGIVRVTDVDPEEVDAVYSEASGRLELSGAKSARAEVHLAFDCRGHEEAIGWHCKARSYELFASY